MLLSSIWRAASPSGEHGSKHWGLKLNTNWSNCSLHCSLWRCCAYLALCIASVLSIAFHDLCEESKQDAKFAQGSCRNVGRTCKENATYIYAHIAYLPHEAVAEYSNLKEPVRRGFLEVNWFERQLMSDSNELRIKGFGDQLIWGHEWFCCQLIWGTNDLVAKLFGTRVFGCQPIWDSNDLAVNWFLRFMSTDLRFKGFGYHLIWDSNDLVISWREIQMIWLDSSLSFKLFGAQLIWDSSDLVLNWFEVQLVWLRLPSEMTLGSSKTKLFCKTC